MSGQEKMLRSIYVAKRGTVAIERKTTMFNLEGATADFFFFVSIV